LTATLTRTRPARVPDASDLRLEPRSRRRRPLLALSSALLVAVCVAVFTNLYLRAGHQVSVLAIARPVEQGQAISSDDLAIVRVSLSPGVAVVPANEENSVVGHRVSVAIGSGSLLTPSDLVGEPSPPPIDAIVGVALKPSQLPAAGVSSGETVDIVMTGVPGSPYSASGNGVAEQPTASAVSGPGTILAPDVHVSEVALPSAASGSDTVVVSLVVPRVLAPIVASASAAGQAALVVVAPSS